MLNASRSIAAKLIAAHSTAAQFIAAQFIAAKPQRLPTLLPLLVLPITLLPLTSAIATPQTSRLLSPAPTTITQLPSTPLAPPTALTQAIQQDIRRRTGNPKATATITSLAARTWPDSCLGLPKPDELCTQATVNGWHATVTDGQQFWTYRTDLAGKQLRVHEWLSAVIPHRVATQLLRRVAQDHKVPLNTLRITAARSQTFDGCMGIQTRPDQACTMIAMDGWRTVITSNPGNQQRSWVYHLDRTGNSIAYNPTASGASRTIRASFAALDNWEPAGLDPKVLFQSEISRGGGNALRLTLQRDGRLMEQQIGPTIRSQPVLRKKLTPQQVNQFQQLLQRENFSNLDRLSYFADVMPDNTPINLYYSPVGFVHFIDLDPSALPMALQRVRTAWTALSQGR